MRAAAQQFGITYCASAGVTLSPPASTAPATPAASATAVTTSSGGQPQSPTSATPSVSTFTGAAEPLTLHNPYSWMLAVLGLAGGLVAVDL
jgi:hypothetical protein